VAARSCGIARLINSTCDTLLIAFSETKRTVEVEIFREACIELMLLPRRSCEDSDPLIPLRGPRPVERTVLTANNQLRPEAAADGSFGAKTSLHKSALSLNEPVR
jgi:hypothetical protein